ncbi:MAG: response regulator [Elusimicrobiales bacterium]|nr:response regulator [Elusimicrobiales bacterium]
MAKERPKILLVDDNVPIHTLLNDILRKEGYDLFSASDAMQGLMEIKRVKPDLLLLDMNMPAGGGQSVYERVRRMSEFLHMPILIYSTTPREELVKKFQTGPALEIIDKNAPLDKLLEAIKTLLSDS